MKYRNINKVQCFLNNIMEPRWKNPPNRWKNTTKWLFVCIFITFVVTFLLSVFVSSGNKYINTDPINLRC